MSGGEVWPQALLRVLALAKGYKGKGSLFLAEKTVVSFVFQQRVAYPKVCHARVR
jgi:hypothetical protein